MNTGFTGQSVVKPAVANSGAVTGSPAPQVVLARVVTKGAFKARNETQMSFAAGDLIDVTLSNNRYCPDSLDDNPDTNPVSVIYV